MRLPELSVKRPVTVLMLVFIVLILGGVSLSKLPIDLMPDIEIPVAIVQTNYDGVGPQEIEKSVTRPIEEVISRVQNIDKVNSMSSEGSSIVIAQFKFGTNMDYAALDMREKVDLIKKMLPSDVSNPMVMKIDINAQPIIQLSLNSEDGDLTKLQTIAEDVIKPGLERVEGVASVSIMGGYKNEVEVKLNQEKMKGYGLDVNYLANIIRAENLNSPGGKVQKGQHELTIRTVGEFESLDEIKNLIVTLPAGGSILLKDLAEVSLKHKDVTTMAKTNGKNSIDISIQKQSGTNSVKVSDEANKQIEKLRQEYPQYKFEIILDMADYVKRSINNVKSNAVAGAILAVAILYLFLRNVRTTLIIGTAIPISIIATFILIYFSGITLNLMTLGGLALGVGMLVDNAIVVLDNIYRFRQNGFSRAEAAIKGASEVGMAVTASTLTTVAVFLPIVFVQGITAEIFKELAMVVTMSLFASLAVSLTLVPMLSAKILKVDRNQGERRTGAKGVFDLVYFAFDRLFGGMESTYKRMLKWSLAHRKSTVAIGVLTFILSMASIALVGAEFFPESDEGWVTVEVTLPDGAELKDTNEVISQIEEKALSIPEANNVFSIIGTSGDMSMKNNANIGSVYVKLKELKSRTRGVSQVTDELRELVKDIPGARIKVSVLQTMNMGGSATPINISIKGDDLTALKKIGDDFKELVESVEGTREVRSSFEEGTPEVRLGIDRKAASQYGLTAGQIASSVKGTISGVTATRFKVKGDEIDVVVKGDDTFRSSLTNLEETPISTPSGMIVPLGQVAEVKIERGPSTINREAQVRVISVSAQIIGRDLKSIVTDIEQKLGDYQLPEGYEYEMGGQNKELNDAFKDLSLALILAVVLVYMILASQFESLLHPLSIMLSVPLGFSGGALGLLIARKAFSVPAFIGLIMLAGIVVNNAIVLVDYVNTRRKAGEDRTEAIVNAGPVRLRPILMTTLTTVLGLIPLALGIGEGAEAQAPMAITVIGGLTLSTMLTLVFVPVMYTIFDDIANFFKLKALKYGKMNKQAQLRG